MATEDEKIEVLGKIARGEIGKLSPEDRKRAGEIYAQRFNARSMEKAKVRRDEILANKEGTIDPETVGKSMTETVLDPGAMAADAKAGILSAANRFTMGANSLINRGLSKVTGGRLGATEEQEQEVLQGSGDKLGGVGAADVGDMTGAAASSVAGPAAAVARKVAPAFAAKTATGRIAQGAASGAAGGMVVGGVEGGTEAAAEGKNPIEILAAAAERARDAGAMGGIAGGAFATLGEGARLVKDKLRQGDGKAATFFRERDKGTYNDPEIKRLKGEEGITEAAQKARDRIVTRDSDLVATAKAGQARATGEAAAATPKVKIGALASRLDDMAKQNRILDAAGNPTDDIIDPALESVINEARRLAGAPDEAGTVATKNLLNLRKYLSDRGGFGKPKADLTPEQNAARAARGTLREALREQVPGLAEADDAFVKVKTASERRNDLLFGSEEGADRAAGRVLDDTAGNALEDAVASEPDLRFGKAKTAAQRLARAGDKSNAALFENEALKKLAADDPEIAAAIDYVRAVKAKEGMRPTLADPNTTNIRRLMSIGGAADTIGRNAGIGALRGTDATARAAEGLSDLFNIQRAPQARMTRSTPEIAAPAPSASLFEVLSEAARENERRKGQR